MPLLTKQVLDSLGIELNDASYRSLANHFETTLDERIITEVVEYLTPEQAEHLASMQDAEGADIYSWLKDAVPELAEIISDEVDILLGELAENSEHI